MKFTDQSLCDAYLTEEMRKILSWSGYHLSDQADFIKVSEFLKFMYLTSVYGGGFIPVSPEIDEVWHVFVLQTRLYPKFCLSLPGKRFIDHQTLPFQDFFASSPKNSIDGLFSRWIPLYNFHFYGFTEKNFEYWGFAKLLFQHRGLSFEEINAIGCVWDC